MHWQNACKLADDFIISIADQPLEITRHDQAAIDQIWEIEQQRNGLLFNGTVISAIDITSTHMRSRWISYKDALAAYRNHELAERLQIRPVAVSGMLWAGDCVLLGQRAEHLAQYPGYLELAPSGGLDSADFRGVLMRELFEETGIASEAVASVQPFAIVREDHLTVVHLCMHIRLRLNEPPALNPPESEYQQFFWVPKSDLNDFLATSPYPIVPLTTWLAHNLQR